MANPVVLAVLVYASGGHGGAPARTGEGPRARIVAALQERATIIEHAIDAARADRRDGWRMRAELEYLARGKTALEEGRRAREAVELDESERQLALAERAYGEGLPAPGIASLCAEAALEHGVTLGELGRTTEAKDAFSRALAWSPNLVLTERLARPDVVRLFRDVARAHPPQAAAIAPAEDAIAPQLERLRDAPSQPETEMLVAALGVDAAIVVASSSDGARTVGVRVERGCSTKSSPLDDPTAVRALLDAPCEPGPWSLRLDDPRLVAPVPEVVLVHPTPTRRKRKVWPIVVGSVLGVAAATVIGVTVGYVLTDPRYTAHVDGKGFAQ